MPIEFIPVTDSTNSEMRRRLASSHVPEGLLLYAGSQTAGRGQRGNTWHSLEGDGLYATMILRPQSLSVEVLPVVVKSCALAVANVVEVLIGQALEAKIKWPNDIFLGGRKIAGVLVETGIRGDRVHELILGFGINLNQLEFPESFSTEAVSARQVTGTRMGVHYVAQLMQSTAMAEIGQISEPDQQLRIAQDYHARLFGKGLQCLFQSEVEGVTGKLLEIDDAGRARVLTDSGEKRLSHPVFRFVGLRPDEGLRSDL